MQSREGPESEVSRWIREGPFPCWLTKLPGFGKVEATKYGVGTFLPSTMKNDGLHNEDWIGRVQALRMYS